MKLLNQLYSIQEKNDTPSGVDFIVRLNPQHIIYQAHFPGEPITPGVVLIQIVKELSAMLIGDCKQLHLTAIKNVKFLSVISPYEHPEIKVNISIDKLETEFTVKTIISADDSVFAKMSLTLSDGQF